MVDLSREFIRDHLADSAVIFKRGVHLFEHGSFVLKQADMDKGWFAYEMDGNYGDYTIRIQLADDKLVTSCDCPYPGIGCKHTVAALLDTRDVVQRWRQTSGSITTPPVEEPYLAPEEIRQQALEDRKRRARNEAFTVTEGEMLKGEHLVETTSGRQYIVTLHDPANGQGHCNCPDYLTNRIGTCKHLVFLVNYLKKKRGFNKQVARERFPFVDIYWDAVNNQPRVFADRPLTKIKSPDELVAQDGNFQRMDHNDLSHRPPPFRRRNTFCRVVRKIPPIA
ncbi:MAG: SWIM zinc finger family protein [Desulfobacterales bacterium]|jgi:hypothetical protein